MICATEKRDFPLRYRAPEVVLQGGWSYESDVWSIGCTIAELATGTALFPDQINENVHLMLMEKCLERRLPQALLERAWQKGVARSNNWLVKSNQGRYSVNRKIGDILQEKKFNGCNALSDMVSDLDLFDLLCKLLEFDPAKRPKAGPLRKHRFFAQSRFDRSDIDVKTAYPPLPSPPEDLTPTEDAPCPPPAQFRGDEMAQSISAADMNASRGSDMNHVAQEELEQQQRQNLEQQAAIMAQLDSDMQGLKVLQQQLTQKARAHGGGEQRTFPASAQQPPARTQSVDQLEELLHELQLQGNMAIAPTASQESMEEVDELLLELQSRTQKTLEEAKKIQETMFQRTAQLRTDAGSARQGAGSRSVVGRFTGSHPPDVNITTPPSQMYRPVSWTGVVSCCLVQYFWAYLMLTLVPPCKQLNSPQVSPMLPSSKYDDMYIPSMQAAQTIFSERTSAYAPREASPIYPAAPSHYSARRTTN
jgi:hypothetical protein